MRQALSQRALQAQPSPTLALTARAQELRRQGIDVLSFTAGEPDFDTPDFAKIGGLEAIHAGYTKYTPTPGILPLREAIAEKFERENGLRYTPDQIVVSCGAKHSLFGAFMAILDPGDEGNYPHPVLGVVPRASTLDGRDACVRARRRDDRLPARLRRLAPRD
jgi:aspartate aminotransferase